MASFDNVETLLFRHSKSVHSQLTWPKSRLIRPRRLKVDHKFSFNLTADRELNWTQPTRIRIKCPA